MLIFQSQWYSDPGKNDQDCHNDPNIMIMRKWIVMLAFRRKIGSFLLIYGYAPIPTLHRSIKITFNPNDHCPGRCILCTLVFEIIQNFCRIPIFGFSSKTKDNTVFQNIWKQFLNKLCISSNSCNNITWVQ